MSRKRCQVTFEDLDGIRHSVGQLRRWLDLGSSNPMDETKRKRLRELLA